MSISVITLHSEKFPLPRNCYEKSSCVLKSLSRSNQEKIKNIAGKRLSDDNYKRIQQVN